MKHDLTVGFLSLGLIGGSIAQAIRQYHPEAKIYAYNRSPKATELAKKDKTLDYVMESVTDRIEDCDVIFLCAPIGCNIEFLSKLKDCEKKDCIITDVGSVKTNIHNAAALLGLNDKFIGGHPMTGSEKTGYESAKASLLENSYYILTPTPETNSEKLQWMKDFISSLKALAIVSDYETHDFATAAISHVPHLIAATLVELVEENDSPDQFMKLIAAGGFKDITRIASASPVMWEHICQSNAQNIIKLLDLYQIQLNQIKNSLLNEQFHDVNDLFVRSGAYRGSLNDHGKSTISKSYQLYMDIKDEAGAIAKVAGILAKADLSIKNIGITHNREHEEGVLYIVFYDEESMKNAIPILSDFGYHVIQH